MIQPKVAYQTPPRPRVRVAAHATQKRRAHARRARYSNCARALAYIGLAGIPIMLYVMLTANLTGLNYAIAHAQHERSIAQDDVQRLDDRIAHLESRERLAQIATKLGMREPQSYAVVTIPPPAPHPKVAGLALLEWFKTP